MPGDLDVLSLQVPSGTTETVIVPWHIESQHPHRIEIKSEEEVRLVGADGHEHVVYADGDAPPEQVSYSPAGSGRAEHAHSIEQVNVEGPVFAQTRPHAPTSNTGGGTLNVTAGSSIAPGRPAQVPNLHTETAQTEPDSTGHQHEVLVSPHEYWSGDFILPGEGHTHQVDDWVVQEAGGHQHVIDKPPIPENRALIPRLTRYEGKQLLEESESPFVMNVHIEDGWTVASVPEGLSGQLLLGVETGGVVDPPTEALEDANEPVTLGLGPDAGCDAMRMNVGQARTGAPILLHVRAEDKYSGGLEKEEITLTWDGGSRSLKRYTNERGWAIFEVPLKDGKTDYTVTATAAGGCSLQRTITIDALEELDGYGVEWGIEYGS